MKLAQTVIVTNSITSNGATEHPAIVTRVWNANQNPDGSIGFVNAAVMPDFGGTFTQGSIYVYPDRDTGIKAQEAGNYKCPFAYLP